VKSRPFRIVAENPPTAEQARAMVIAAAPQIAALLDAFERQEAADGPGSGADRLRSAAVDRAGVAVVATG